MAKVNRGLLDQTLAAMFSNPTYRQDYLFYAHMIGMCSIKIRPDLPAPAAVSFMHDHYNLYINPKEFDEFTLVERLAVLKHEMLHILYGHLDRIGSRNMKIFNYSSDCALNQQINQKHLPDTAVMPKNLGEMLKITVPNNKSAEDYYELIKNKMKKDSQDGKGESQDGKGESQDGKGESQDGKGESQDGKGESQDGKGNCELLDSHDTWEESEGDKDLQKDMTKRMIEKSQEETIKNKGTVPNACSDWLELHSHVSEVNWQRVLRGIVGNKRVGKRSTIMRSDRRFPKRDDLRGKTKERMFNLLVIADVSGSMSDQALLSTFGEVRHICDLTKTAVDLIQVDTQAYEPEKLSKKTKLIQRKGNGGTYLNPAIDMAKARKIDYNAVVVITDGGLFGDDITYFKQLNKKVIWLVEETGQLMPEMAEGKMQSFKLKGSK